MGLCNKTRHALAMEDYGEKSKVVNMDDSAYDT